jgi:hypothetical protein
MKKNIYLLFALLLMSGLVFQQDAFAFGNSFPASNCEGQISKCYSIRSLLDFEGCVAQLIEGVVGASIMVLSFLFSVGVLFTRKGRRKYLYAVLFFIIALSLFVLRSIMFLAFKPVIYLYPEKSQEVNVQLDYAGELTVTYPKYDFGAKGWNVIANPDGKLTNLKDGKEYSYLFWEGAGGSRYVMPTTGYVVKGEDSAEFLQEILSKAGLTPVEYNEFIVFWYPQIKDYPYVQIAFAGKEYEDSAKLTINPKPDSVLRVFVYFKKLSSKKEIEPQVLPEFKREGFSVVEWGGTVLSR